MHESDVVVVGGGHNSLIAAAYLAKAGYAVTVLEAGPTIGGNTATREITLPGFWHDLGSSAHTVFQNSPVFRNNEFELDKYGLRYIYPDVACMMPFLDGRSITLFRDRERNNPPGEKAAVLATERAKSAVDVICERFEEPHVRAFLGWLAGLTMEPIHRPGTGLLPFATIAGRQEHSWVTPVGGSALLPRALVRFIEAHGGRVITGAKVDRILIRGGRAAGATAGGETYHARRAVLSTAHLKQMPSLLGETALPADFVAGVNRWRAGLTFFVVHLALRQPPRYRTEAGYQTVTAAGTAETLENLILSDEQFFNHKIDLSQPCLLGVNSSLVDPSRAPAGMHTYKMTANLPYDLAGDPAEWDRIKEQVADDLLAAMQRYAPNLTRENILARAVFSPLDLERVNPSNWHGSAHGGATDPDQSGLNRPVPGYSQYRGPVPGLYMTGAWTHPGGSVSGAPGRNAALIMLADLQGGSQ